MSKERITEDHFDSEIQHITGFKDLSEDQKWYVNQIAEILEKIEQIVIKETANDPDKRIELISGSRMCAFFFMNSFNKYLNSLSLVRDLTERKTRSQMQIPSKILDNLLIHVSDCENCLYILNEKSLFDRSFESDFEFQAEKFYGTIKPDNFVDKYSRVLSDDDFSESDEIRQIIGKAGDFTRYQQAILSQIWKKMSLLKKKIEFAKAESGEVISDQLIERAFKQERAPCTVVQSMPYLQYVDDLRKTLHLLSVIQNKFPQTPILINKKVFDCLLAHCDDCDFCLYHLLSLKENYQAQTEEARLLTLIKQGKTSKDDILKFVLKCNLNLEPEKLKVIVDSIYKKIKEMISKIN